MKSMNPLRLTMMTALLLFQWTDCAHAHGLPLFLLPVVGSFVFFPLALLTSLMAWLTKGLYYSDSASQRGLSTIAWSDALKEAGLMYGCFILAAFVLDLGHMLLSVSP